MPVGPSGRIVVEIDPALKQQLYAALEVEGMSFKHWLLGRIEAHLENRVQLSLDLSVPGDNPVDKVARG